MACQQTFVIFEHSKVISMSFSSKKEFREFLKYERSIYFKNGGLWLPLPFREKDILFTFIYLLRKTEYHEDRKHRIRAGLFKLLYQYVSFKYALHIPPHVCGKGLSIAHVGPVIIHGKCVVGENLRIHVGANIGANGGLPPKLGNNVYVAPGAKIFGDIYIADGCKIGANAVVNKSCDVENSVLVGVPAKPVVK